MCSVGFAPTLVLSYVRCIRKDYCSIHYVGVMRYVLGYLCQDSTRIG
jgi:hypothetical protein